MLACPSHSSQGGLFTKQELWWLNFCNRVCMKENYFGGLRRRNKKAIFWSLRINSINPWAWCKNLPSTVSDNANSVLFKFSTSLTSFFKCHLIRKNKNIVVPKMIKIVKATSTSISLYFRCGFTSNWNDFFSAAFSVALEDLELHSNGSMIQKIIDFTLIYGIIEID